MVGMEFKAGEPIVRGYTDTGDHVFVDKVSYNFRKPALGEVIVFTTADIPMSRGLAGLRRGFPRNSISSASAARLTIR
jgi:signal peptidase I